MAQCKYLSLRHLHHCWDEKDTRPSSNMFKTTLAHAPTVFSALDSVYVCAACNTRYARVLSPIETYAGQHYLKDKAV